jgi:hypothetical protein
MPQSKHRMTIDPLEVEKLQARMRGRVLCAGNDGYDTARKIHNGIINRHPLMIARCAGVADVRQALEFALDKALPVSIRSGGHVFRGLRFVMTA